MKINILKNYKICSSDYCPFYGQPQPLENFSKDAKGKGGLFAKCKACNKIYRESRGESLTEYTKEYYQKNKEKIKLRSKHRRETHREEIKQYLQDHKEEINVVENIYRNKRREEDVDFRLSENLRSRTNAAIRGDFKAGSAVADLGILNGGIKELKIWLEQQFYPHPITGEIMTWENYGKKWHVDHIIPLSTVNLKDRKQFLKVSNWFNLRPLWAEENIARSNRI